MPRYYFNIRRKGEIIEDEEGVEFGDVSCAIAEAMASARELAALAIIDCHPIDGDRVEVRDDSGKVSFIVPLMGMVG